MNHPLLAMTFDALAIALLAGSVALGAGVAIGVAWVFKVLRTEDLAQDADWRYDVSRINELRRIDLSFRIFQPVIQIFARFNRGAMPDLLPEIQREIHAAGLSRFWLPEEYLGRAELASLMLTPLYVYAGYRWMEWPGVFLGLSLTLFTVWLLRRRLAGQARRRLVAIKRRMPFLLDLVTLLMEAGSTFLQAMKQAVEEFAEHPVGTEFGRVLMDMNLGKPRTESFRAMRDRLKDDEITSIIGAIVQGEELGTPLARIFRTQADVLRIKRTQRAETVAGEAGVNMLLPGILVMMSTVLIILGPFVLNYLYSGLSL